MKLKDVIKEATHQHLLNGGLFFGQCVTAVGWIGGTVPNLSEADGIVELPTSDSSNPAVVCGAALAGKRPIYTIRYQGFMAYNGSSLINYAAKSLEMWGIPCPIFVRAIAMEGGIGPVASGVQHGLAMHNPGMLVAAPITPQEWLDVWEAFLLQDKPIYCSEHRKSFNVDYEINDNYSDNLDINSKVSICVFGIGISRLTFDKLDGYCKSENIFLHTINILWLKPLKINSRAIMTLKESDFGIVVDSSYVAASAAEHVANTLMLESTRPVFTIGLPDRTTGFAKDCDNQTPNAEEIFSFIKSKRASFS